MYSGISKYMARNILNSLKIVFTQSSSVNICYQIVLARIYFWANTKYKYPTHQPTITDDVLHIFCIYA